MDGAKTSGRGLLFEKMQVKRREMALAIRQEWGKHKAHINNRKPIDVKGKTENFKKLLQKNR